jgi:hypothetical protein
MEFPPPVAAHAVRLLSGERSGGVPGPAWTDQTYRHAVACGAEWEREVTVVGNHHHSVDCPRQDMGLLRE